MTEQDKDKAVTDAALDEDAPSNDEGKDTRLVENAKLTDSIDPPSESNDDPTISNPPKPRRFLLPLVAGTLLLVVVGVGALGYYFWQQIQSDYQALQAEQAVLLEELQRSQQQFQGFEQLNAQTNDDWKAGVRALENLLVSSAQKLNAQANRTENRWPLEEALTLTRLAQQRLRLDSNAQVAVGLLSAADQIIAGLDQAAVLTIRRQLAEDILALETTPSVDVNGAYFRLQAISGQIKELSWIPKPRLQTEVEEGATPPEGFWHSLKQIVVVTKLEVPKQAPPLQTDFERWRQHVLLLIEQSQLALLARNQLLFDAALEQTTSQLIQMSSQFDIDVWQSELSEMASSVLNPEWPAIQASVTAIENYIAEQSPQVNEEVTP